MLAPGMALDLLYRGSLASCNYACDYCPFAKTTDGPAELAIDARELARFVAWVQSRPEDSLRILFTPWGEALVRRHYREALITLSHLPQVRRVAIQTNLSGHLGWVHAARRETLALWCTFHPTQTCRRDFLAQCAALDHAGLRYSVGVVGLREHFEEIAALRAELAPETYLWINAFKREATYYQPAEIAFLEQIDPLFRLNLVHHASWQRDCRTGATALSVAGDGTLRRCHFIPDVLGNLYDPGFAAALRQRPCSAQTCGCYIGYAFLPHLGLDDIFGESLLERIPRPAFRERSCAPPVP